MASRTIVNLIDDLDGSEADETVRFSLDGVEYEIDLSVNNAQDLRDSMSAYVSNGRRVSGTIRGAHGIGPGRSSSGARRSAGLTREEMQNVRDWANRNGYTVAPRGRIKQEVLDAYKQAH